MPLDPMIAFAIFIGLCAMAIGHVLQKSTQEHRQRELRRATARTPLA